MTHTLVKLRTLLIAAGVLALATATFGQRASDSKQTFDVRAGEAEVALKQFSEQAGQQVIFPTELVRGIRTNAVRGELSAREALEAMLVDTGLTIGQDSQSGAFAVRRETALEKNGGSRRDSRAAAKDTLQLDTYEVISSKVDGLNNKSIFDAHEEAALPYNVISRVDIERLGATSMEELFRHVPEATNYGNVLQSAVGNTNVTGGQTYSTAAVNLRGFGTTQTIVLVNGRRLGQGSNVGGPDISRIPIGSIERIEILPAAAAAVYGGGAVGGAVNIILRKNYSGADVTTYVGTSTNGGGTEFRVTYLDGRTYNEGRTKLTMTFDYNTREPVYLRDRDYLDNVLAKYGPNTEYRTATGVSMYETVTLRAFAGMPGTIVLQNATGGLGIPGNPGARYAAVPVGLTAAQANALTPSSFSATAGTANLEPRYQRSVLYRPQDNYSAGLQLEHDILPDGKLSFYAEANAAFQRQLYFFPQFFSLSLAANHPFNPFRTNVTPGFVGLPVTLMMDTPDIEDPSSLQERNDARLTLGFKGKVNDNWEWTFDASGQYQRLYSDAYNPSNYLTSLIGSVTLTGAGADPLATRWDTYNPFVDRDLYPISRADHASLFYYNRQNAHYNRNAQVAVRVVGDLFELPAGPVRISPGADVRWDQRHGFQYIPASERMLDLTGFTVGAPSRTPLSDTLIGAYLETTIPIISQKWRPIPVQSFEIGASRRWDRGNHIRSVASNTISGNAWIVRDVMFRASLTEGFVPLDRTNITAPIVATNVSLNVTDPLRGNVQQLTTIPTHVSGGNPLIRTEFARTRNFGMVAKPRFIPGLTVNVNYFLTKRFDTPSTPAIADVLNFPGDYEGRVERAPLTPADQAAGYTGGAITRLDLTRINLASVIQDGFDYRISYQPQLDRDKWGQIFWSANVTNYNSHRTRTRPNGPEINQVDVQNQPLRWRGNSSIFWQGARWESGITASYINSYYGSTTQRTPAVPTATGVDGRKIKHSLLFDVRASYKIPAGSLGDTGWLRYFNSTQFSVGALNVLDREPPMFTDSTGFYSRYNDPRQRFVYLEVKKSL
jgi:iron complex outermembrane recepter protein